MQPMMGGANPANLEQLAAAGDPRAIQMLQQMQALRGGAGGGMGGVPPGPPMNGSPMQAGGPAPGMSQADFSGYGAGSIPPDVQARRAQQLIRLLRAQQ